jgi:hypothetical protein
MTAPTNTVTTLVTIGQREDLSDKIWRVAAEETPLLSNISKGDASARFTEWQTEVLATPVATNAQLEGDDYTAAAGNFTTRLGNYCMISAAAYTVSRTADKVRTAGRANETNRLKGIRMLEVRRDQEMRAIGNYASVNESGATTRKYAGALAWLTTNDSRGAGGSDGGFSAGIVAAATNGTQRSFTESLFKTCMANLFSARGMGRNNYQAYMGGTHKQQFSAFTGIAAIRVDAPASRGMAHIVGAADTMQTDFGFVTAIPHPYGLTRDCFICDPEYWEYASLDGMSNEELGKTGDARKWLITTEGSIVSKNERASAVVADLT